MNEERIEPALVRLFLAVELTAETRAALARAQGRLRQERARVGWMAAENLHITMAFLGDTEPTKVEPMQTALDAVGRTVAPFSCRIEGLGNFGSPRAPRVIWAGVSAGAEPLTRLQAGIAAAVAQQGLALEEREFHAHVTLGRVRSARDAGTLLAAMEALQARAFGDVPVNRFVLMRSELLPEGPRYAVLHPVPLLATT